MSSDDDSQKGINVMEQNIVILSADLWSMVDEKTGEQRTGTSIFYVPNLDKVTNETGKSYGYKPVKESLPAEFIKEIAAAGGCPIDAKVTFQIRMQSGKQVLKIASCQLKK